VQLLAMVDIVLMIMIESLAIDFDWSNYVSSLSIPVVINGSVTSVSDIVDTLITTQAHAVMVARGFLENPRMLVQPQADPAFLAAEYLDCAEKYPPPSPLYLQKHLRWIFRACLQPKKKYPDDYADWRPRLWTFLVRPYLETIDQFRQVVALYVKLNGSDMPESLSNQPEPSFQSIRHHGRTAIDEQCSVETLEESQAEVLASLFQ
jgi:tRNA-dihydrouridine synthase